MNPDDMNPDTLPSSIYRYKSFMNELTHKNIIDYPEETREVIQKVIESGGSITDVSWNDNHKCWEVLSSYDGEAEKTMINADGRVIGYE